MHRDYVRSTRPARKRKSSRPAPRRSAPAPFPLLRALLALGLVVAFGLFLYRISGAGDSDPPATSQAPTKPKPIPIEEQRPAKEKFDYMHLLENKEVKVDIPSAAEATIATVPSRPYQMQCGSFRSQEQADALKVRIAFQGINSQVRRSEGKNGVWYRVVLGPYPGRRDAQSDMNKLRRAKVIQDCGIWLWEG